ncbi:ABC transporter ATP-binding protein, partial [Rhizobium ruizarguesonis]
GDAVTGFEFPAALANRLSEARAEKGKLTLGVRSEGVLVSREDREGFMPVEAHIIEPLGSQDIVDLKVGHQMIRARTKSG